MYSTLLDDEEYDPLLMVYLTTTGATLQNHTRAQLITYALKQVLYGIARVPESFNVSDTLSKSLETKRQLAVELRREQQAADDKVAALNAISTPTLPATTTTVPPGVPDPVPASVPSAPAPAPAAPPAPTSAAPAVATPAAASAAVANAAPPVKKSPAAKPSAPAGPLDPLDVLNNLDSDEQQLVADARAQGRPLKLGDRGYRNQPPNPPWDPSRGNPWPGYWPGKSRGGRGGGGP